MKNQTQEVCFEEKFSLCYPMKLKSDIGITGSLGLGTSSWICTLYYILAPFFPENYAGWRMQAMLSVLEFSNSFVIGIR